MRRCQSIARRSHIEVLPGAQPRICYHFQDISNQGIVTLTFSHSRSSKVKPIDTLYNLYWVQHCNSYRSCHISCQKVWPWFLTPQGHPRSNLTALMESPCILHISAPWGPTLYVAVFKIFRIKGFWRWPLTPQSHPRSNLMVPIKSP